MNDHYCTVSALKFWFAAYKRALPVYIPVYLLPLFLFHLKPLLRSPWTQLASTLVNINRSCIFLSSYCMWGWLSSCYIHHYLGLSGSVVGYLSGVCAGFNVALEKKNRRIELALYVLAQAIPAFWKCMQDFYGVVSLPHGEVALFAISMSGIMWSYCVAPHLMRKSYLSLFRFFFGSGGLSEGFGRNAHRLKLKENQQVSDSKENATNNLTTPVKNTAGQNGSKMLASVEESDRENEVSTSLSASPIQMTEDIAASVSSTPQKLNSGHDTDKTTHIQINGQDIATFST